MGVIAKGIPRGCQGLFTPVSLGYPLSVFNKNSTLKPEMFYFASVFGLELKILRVYPLGPRSSSRDPTKGNPPSRNILRAN